MIIAVPLQARLLIAASLASTWHWLLLKAETHELAWQPRFNRLRASRLYAQFQGNDKLPTLSHTSLRLLIQHKLGSVNRDCFPLGLEKLAANGYLVSENRELPKAGKSTIYLPRISTKKALDAIVPLRPDEHLTCVEEYKWSAMRSRMSPESSRTLNLGTLTKAYRTKENATRKRGAPSKKKGTEQEELDELAEDLAAVAVRESAFFLEILKLVENSETTDAGLPCRGQMSSISAREWCSKLFSPGESNLLPGDT